MWNLCWIIHRPDVIEGAVLCLLDPAVPCQHINSPANTHSMLMLCQSQASWNKRNEKDLKELWMTSVMHWDLGTIYV